VSGDVGNCRDHHAYAPAHVQCVTRQSTANAAPRSGSKTIVRNATSVASHRALQYLQCCSPPPPRNACVVRDREVETPVDLLYLSGTVIFFLH